MYSNTLIMRAIIEGTALSYWFNTDYMPHVNLFSSYNMNI